MTSEDIMAFAQTVAKEQTEALKSGFRELTILLAEHNALLAKQNAALLEMRDAMDTLVSISAEAAGIEMDEGEEDTEDGDDEAS